MIKYILHYDGQGMNPKEIESIIKFCHDREIEIIALPHTYQISKYDKDQLQFMKETIEKELDTIEMFETLEQEGESTKWQPTD